MIKNNESDNLKMMSEGRVRKTARNVTFAYINQIVTVILSFVSRTIFIRVLGVEYLGISGLFSDILTMLSLADLGMDSAMTFSYYKPLAEGNTEKVAALLNFYKKIYYTIAAVVFAIGISLTPFLKYLVNLDNDIPHLTYYYILFLMNTVVSYLFVYKTSLITADQKNYLISKYKMIFSILKSIFQCIFLLVLKNYFIYLVINIIATLVNNIFASFKADQLYPYIKHNNIKLQKDESKNIFKSIGAVFIYKTASVVMNGTDNTLISIIVGTVWVGIYSNYNLIISTINTFINLLYSSATASVGNIIAKESTSKKYEAFVMVQSVSLLITTFSTLCLYLLMDDFIFLWLGTDYVFNKYISLSIILNFYICGIVHPIWSFREATGLFNQTKYIMPICALVNIIFSVVLGYRFGVAGILFASAIARLSTYFWYEPRVLFSHFFGQSARTYYVAVLKNFLIVTISCLLLSWISNNFLVFTWSRFFIKCICVLFFALMITFIFYRNTDGFKLLKNKIIMLARRS